MEELQADSSILFNSEILKIDRNLILLTQFGLFVFALIGFIIGIKYVHKKTLTSILTGFQKFRFNRFWFAFAIWGVLLIIIVAIQYFSSTDDLTINFNLGGFLISLLC